MQPRKLGLVLSRVLALVSVDLPMLGFAGVCLVIAALAELAIPRCISAVIFAVAEGDRASLMRILSVLGGACVTFAVFAALRGSAFSVVNQRLVRRLRERVFGSILTQETAYFDEHETGELVSRLSADCQSVARCLAVNLNVMLRNGMQALLGMVYLAWVSPKLAAVTTAMVTVLWVATLWYGAFSRRAGMAFQDAAAGAGEVAEESIRLVRTVRVFGTEQRELGRYGSALARMLSIDLRRAVAYGGFVFTSALLFNATRIFALFVGGLWTLNGTLTAEQLTTFILYVELVMGATGAVADQWAVVMESVGASERVLELAQLPPARQFQQQQESAKAAKAGEEDELPSESAWGVRFEGVTFRYPSRPDRLALRGVDLDVAPGEVVALVGASGSGKSTLVSLVQRLYEPASGRVVVGGRPMDEINLGRFRRGLGVVTQEPHLFSGTVEENVRYGCEGATKEDVERALAIAQADGFVAQLPEGVDTRIGDVALSGGQKQRLAIARALVRNPRLLILDEATSALDTESEAQVQAALANVIFGSEGGEEEEGKGGEEAERPTMLIIAHRLSTIRSADRIVVLEDGLVVEQGAHEELMRLPKGAYARMVRRQTAAFADDEEDDDGDERPGAVSTASAAASAEEATENLAEESCAVSLHGGTPNHCNDSRS